MDIVERLRSRRVDVSEVDIAEAADEIERLREEVADERLKKDAAELRADRLCAAVDALSGGELLPMPGGWVNGFRSAISKIHASISGSPDNYLDHCLRVMDNRIDRLRAEVAELRPELNAWVKRAMKEADLLKKAEAERNRLRELLRGVLIGGNHVALLIGADHPPHTVPWQFALSHYGAGDKYEAWCCWKAIMQARDELDRIDAALGGEGQP